MRKERAKCDCTRASRFFFIAFTINSAKVDPPVTVDLSLCSAAFHDVSHVSVLTAMELTA